MIFREISKTFEYIFKNSELIQKQSGQISIGEIRNNQNKLINEEIRAQAIVVENEVIETLIQLGRSSRDLKITLNAATTLAHITEVLNCNEQVASNDAIDFMIDMLKDSKNLKHHRQGCRYFANLSFYESHREKLIKKEIANFLLKAIDGHLDEETIKHSAIAMANLSSHKEFMKSSSSFGHEEGTQMSKTEKWKIKPLIHLLDSAKLQKINLIQSACITLCNMASKPYLHKHFVHEPEISTIKNCLQNPIDKSMGHELTRFMIKLVCNLTKNPEVLPYLLKKGFLEILFEMLSNERQKEIFGNIVTAISYLSLQKEAQEKIIKNNIIQRILEPLTQIHEVDQKMIIIALTSMLFNGIELQREFINNQGLGKLLFFLQQPDKIFYQLACKCFALLSENKENLDDIIEKECLNTIIISCLRTKDIDLETLKEILKIFINLILWRKLKKENIEITCCLCDIGLMVDDLDMNILSIFCLNILSENFQTHKEIKNSNLDLSQKKGLDINDNQNNKKQQLKSIFSRINFLLEFISNKKNQMPQDQDNQDQQDLLVTLITSFYLNLSRNEENRDFLLSLGLFQKLTLLMKSLQFKNKTALCYTNTIFSKLLKYHESRKLCIEERGHELFIEILKDPENQNLYLETLDTIKLFLTKREYLIEFKSIPESFKNLESNCEELDVSILQVLAILSFEKDCHQALKDSDFLDKLQSNGIFKKIFEQFETLTEERNNKKQMRVDSLKQKQYSGEIDNNQNDTKLDRNLAHIKAIMGARDNQAIVNAEVFQKVSTLKKREKHKYRIEELALSISIILSNLSYDPSYIDFLLGKERKKEDNREPEEFQNTRETMLKSKNIETKANAIANDKSMQSKELIMKKPEVKRISGMLNLISHDNPFISEQIAILLANVSHSEEFKYYFITDRSIKSLIQILRFHSKHLHTEVSLIAVLISVLNLSAIGEIITGIENMHFLNSLQEIIKLNNQSLPFVYKSVGLLAISNIYTFSDKVEILPETKSFAFEILKNWKVYQRESQEKDSAQVIKNLVFASLNLFYNILQKTREEQKPKKKSQQQMITNLIDHITQCVIEPFEDEPQIVNIILDLITLFTRDKGDSPLLFNSEKVLKLVFKILKGDKFLEPKTFEIGTKGEFNDHTLKDETIKLASLALCRLTQRFDDSLLEIDSHFVKQLKRFDNFEYMLTYLLAIVQDKDKKIFNEEHSVDVIEDALNQKDDQKSTKTIYELTLDYTLTTLENISYIQTTRDSLSCPKIFEMLINLFIEEIPNLFLERIIIIMYNLQFNLTQNTSFDDYNSLEILIMPFEFLKKLKKIYKNYEKSSETIGDIQNPQNLIKRKIISIVVVASSSPKNHQFILESEFYKQMKRNVNINYQKDSHANEEIELFGLINVALNKNLMQYTHADLKKIHKIANKNQKIDFKTRVDLFTEISKFAAIFGKNKRGPKESEEQKEKVNLKDKKADDEVIIVNCIKAMIYTLIRLTADLNQKNFMVFKYFLIGILECTKNMQNYLYFLPKCKELIAFLRTVLDRDQFDFEGEKFQPQVLQFSLKMIVCEIFFYLKFENDFFKMDDVSESIRLLIQFSSSVLLLNVEKKTQLVSNTLRLLCQMFQSMTKDSDIQKKIIETKAIPFVTSALNLSKSLQPCINIDALFCLNNMMNVNTIALDKQLLNPEIVHKAIIIYLAYRDQVDLEDPIVTFIYSISKYPDYLQLIQDKVAFIFQLLEAQVELFKNQGSQSEKTCQKIFAAVHNMSDNEETCKQLQPRKFIDYVEVLLLATIKNLQCNQCVACVQQHEQNLEKRESTSEQKNLKANKDKISQGDSFCTNLQPIQSKEMIHELALQTLINMCRFQSENVDEIDLQKLLSLISKLYRSFKRLARQFSLRLVTLLTRQWNYEQISKYKKELITTITEFIDQCSEPAEIQLVLINLEKISLFKKLMTELALMKPETKSLVKNLSVFLSKSVEKQEQNKSLDQIIQFLKKLSKQQNLHQSFVEAKIHIQALKYIKFLMKMQKLKTLPDLSKSEEDKPKLKEFLMVTQNVMKMIRNLHEGVEESSESRNSIVKEVMERKQIFDYARKILEDENYKKDDELAVIIVNIIICFNSIALINDNPLLKIWLSDFSKRFIEVAENQNKTKNMKWYMERYIFILELLVTKYLSSVNQEMTLELIEIFKVQDTSQYTKSIWYKMLKILAHLQHLMDILNLPDQSTNREVKKQSIRENLLEFIIKAYTDAHENLCFLYFMKAVMLLTKKCDIAAMYEKSSNFKTVLRFCDEFFQSHYNETQDTLVMEIILYLVDFFKYLLNFSELHQKYFKNNSVVSKFMKMLIEHQQPQVVKQLSAALLEISKIPIFFPDLLGEEQIKFIIQKLIENTSEPHSLEMLVDTLINIMQQTKVPIKYLIATKILELTENEDDWKEIMQNNENWRDNLANSALAILRVLHYILENLENKDSNDFGRDDEEFFKNNLSQQESDLEMSKLILRAQSIDGAHENYNGLRYKTFKYCLLAMTNLLFKFGFGLILQKEKIQKEIFLTLIKYSTFERDAQINLRMLYLMHLQFKSCPSDKEIVPQEMSEQLADFLLANIYKFRKVFDSKETYYIDIPDQIKEETISIVKGENKRNVERDKLDNLIQRLSENSSISSEASDMEENQIEMMQPNLKFARSVGEALNIGKKLSIGQKGSYSRSKVVAKNDSKLLRQITEPPEFNQKQQINFENINSNTGVNSSPLDYQTHQLVAEDDQGRKEDFFFENKNFKLPKINAVKFSLCMALKVLYKLTKKKNNNKTRSFIINRPFTFEILRFLDAYIYQKDSLCLKQVKYVLNIFKNCSELDQTNLNWKKFDIIAYFFKVIERIVTDEIENPQKSNQVEDSKEIFASQAIKKNQKYKIILPILMTFVNLSRRNGIGMSEFYMYFGNPQNAEIINILKEEKNEDVREYVTELLKGLFNFDSHTNSHENIDLDGKINEIVKEKCTNRNELLKELEDCLINTKLKAKIKLKDQIKHISVENLFKCLQKLVDRKNEGSFEEEGPEAIQRILNILVYIYNCLKQENSSNPVSNNNKFLVMCGNQIPKQLANTMLLTNGKRSSSKMENDFVKVVAFYESEKMFETFYKIVTKCESQVFSPIIEFFSLYVNQQYKNPAYFVQFVLPSFEHILKSESTLEGLELKQIMQTLCLMNLETKIILDHDKQILPTLLLALIKNKNFQDTQTSTIIEQLDQIIRKMFLNQIKLSKQVEELLKGMIEMKSLEIQRLALVALYCMAISIHDGQGQMCSYLHFFYEDLILKRLIDNIKASFISKYTDLPAHRFLKISREVEINEIDQNKNQIGNVSLQILDIVIESTSQLLQFDKPQFESLAKINPLAILKRIFMSQGFELLSLLIRLCVLTPLENVTSNNEIRLYARILASMPPQILKQADIAIFNSESFTELQKTQGNNLGIHIKPEISLVNIFQSLANILNSSDDIQTQYFTIFAFTNIVSLLQLKTAQNQNKYIGKKDGGVAQLQLSDIDFQSLTAVISKTGLLVTVLKISLKPHLSDNIMRICMKMLISISFKAQNQRILIGEPLASQSQITSNTEMLFDKLNIQLDEEKKVSQELLKNFINKLHNFDLNQIHQGTYVQFIHLISQILMQTVIPTDCISERINLLPTKTILIDIMTSFCASMDPKAADFINKAAEAPENSEGDCMRKQMLYKFFFFNYTFQIVGDDVVKVLIGAQPDIEQEELEKPQIKVTSSSFSKYKFISEQKSNQLKSQEEQTHDLLLNNLIKSFFQILCVLRGKSKNNQIDQCLKPGSQKKSKEVGTKNTEVVENHNTSQSQDKDSHFQDAENIEVTQQQIDEKQSTSLSIIKMTLFNINKIFDIIISHNHAFTFQLEKDHIDSIMSLITEEGYEENGDIVEGNYQILEKILQLSADNKKTSNITAIDQQKTMIQAIKHTSVYQCCEAYTFLRLLIRVSDKYTDKEAMEAALEKIEPPTLKKQNEANKAK